MSGHPHHAGPPGRPPGEGSTLPYGKDPSVPPTGAEGDEKRGPQWRGARGGPQIEHDPAESGTWNIPSESGTWETPPAQAASESGTNPSPSESGAWRTPPGPSSSSSWVGPAGSEAFERPRTPYPSLDGGDGHSIELTLGWLEQVLQLSFGSSVDVRVAGIGKRWKLRLNEKQIVDIISSLAHYVRQAMPDGGTLTMHAMPLEVQAGESSIRLGVAPGKYIFLGIGHTLGDQGRSDRSGSRPVRARVGLDTCLRIVSDLGGALSVDRKAAGRMAMNLYLPAAD